MCDHVNRVEGASVEAVGAEGAVEATDTPRGTTDRAVPHPLPTPRADIANQPQHACQAWTPGSHYQLTGVGT